MMMRLNSTEIVFGLIVSFLIPFQFRIFLVPEKNLLAFSRPNCEFLSEIIKEKKVPEICYFIQFWHDVRIKSYSGK